MTDTAERQVFTRVLDALLREDHLGLTSRGTPDGPDRWQVRIPAGMLRVPVRADGFQHAIRTARPTVEIRPETGAPYRVDRLDGLLDLLAPQGDPDSEPDPEVEAGWAAFVAECRGDLLARRLAARSRPQVYATIAARRSIEPAGLTGLPGALLDEVLAAHTGHPVYPTDRCRHGLDATELRRYAPEHDPRFPLRWLPVARSELWTTGPLPSWWPVADTPEQVLLPVHPLTAEQTGLPVVEKPMIEVRPTLSMRTVALVDDPYTHLKLPVPTATLGARNRRTLAPGSLVDGAEMARLLDRIAAAEPAFAGRVRHADESRYGHCGDADELRSFLIRRFPRDLADSVVVPVAALAASDPSRPGSPVDPSRPGAAVDPSRPGAEGGGRPGWTVAQRVSGGDPVPLLESYLDLLLDWHVYLWLRHGIALEAHPQNLYLIIDPDGRVGLLYKDDDGARLDPRHAELPLRDRRMVVEDPGELADVFTTITLHLAAAAPLLALAERGVAVPTPAAALRPRLAAARDRWDDGSTEVAAAARLLTERLLTAERLPVKAMLTAGTLLPKQRLGCADVNKYYRRTGPNYLRAGQ